MQISYDGIEFKMLKMEEWTREAVFSEDGVDYLYDYHKIQCQCVLNEGYTDKLDFPPVVNEPDKIEQQSLSAGSATRWNGLKTAGGYLQASQPVVPGDKPPLVQRSTGAPATLVELFKRLAVPRRQLVIWMDSDPNLALVEPQFRDNILFSPLPGKKEDAQHGPSCSVMGMMGSIGNVTIPLRLMFETHIPTCNDPNAPIMLSNRWSISTTYDPDTYAAIHIINGEARFRADLLHQNQLSADTFRNQFLHPIPLGFKREQPMVTLSSDGTSIQYQLIDKQQVLNFPAGAAYAAPKIEITEERGYVSPYGIAEINSMVSSLKNMF